MKNFAICTLVVIAIVATFIGPPLFAAYVMEHREASSDAYYNVQATYENYPSIRPRIQEALADQRLEKWERDEISAMEERIDLVRERQELIEQVRGW